MVKSSRSVDYLKDLGGPAGWEAILRGKCFVPCPNSNRKAIGILVLAHMAPQGLDLSIELGRGVDGVRRARSASHQPHLTRRVGFEPLLDEFGERERVSGVGVHRAHRRLTDREVIGVACVDALEVSDRRLRKHDVGSKSPDFSTDIHSKFECGGNPTIGIAEKSKVPDPNCFTRRRLFALSNPCDFVAGHGGVESTGVAIGDDAVADLDALVGPAGDRARSAEIDVVRWAATTRTL